VVIRFRRGIDWDAKSIGSVEGSHLVNAIGGRVGMTTAYELIMSFTHTVLGGIALRDRTRLVKSTTTA
jgi:hypothetical protein